MVHSVGVKLRYQAVFTVRSPCLPIVRLASLIDFWDTVCRLVRNLKFMVSTSRPVVEDGGLFDPLYINAIQLELGRLCILEI